MSRETVALCGILVIVLCAGCTGGDTHRNTPLHADTHGENTSGESTPPVVVSAGPKQLESGTLAPGDPVNVTVLFRTNEVPAPVLNGSLNGTLVLTGENVTGTGTLWSGSLEPGIQRTYEITVTPTSRASSLRATLLVPESASWNRTGIPIIEHAPEATPENVDGKSGYSGTPTPADDTVAGSAALRERAEPT